MSGFPSNKKEGPRGTKSPAPQHRFHPIPIQSTLLKLSQYFLRELVTQLSEESPLHNFWFRPTENLNICVFTMFSLCFAPVLGLPPESQKFRKRAFLGGGGTYPAPTPRLSFGRETGASWGAQARLVWDFWFRPPADLYYNCPLPYTRIFLKNIRDFTDGNLKSSISINIKSWKQFF